MKPIKIKQKPKKNTRYKARGAILLLIAVIILTSILPIISAEVVSNYEWDNIKRYDAGLKEITIKNSFLWIFPGENLATYKLTDNTDKCFTDCYAEGSATLYLDGYLFTEMNFADKTNKKVTIKKYDIYIKDKGAWKKYNKEVLIAGTYDWRIEGTKDPMESIDWIGSAFGADLTEWAWWNPAYAYRQQITGIHNSIPFRINSSSYSDIDSNGNLEWIYGTSNETATSYIYYNNENDTSIASETTQYYIVQTKPTNHTELNSPINLSFFAPLDINNQKLIDYSDNSYNGTIIGSPLYVETALDAGYYFDGASTDYINVSGGDAVTNQPLKGNYITIMFDFQSGTDSNTVADEMFMEARGGGTTQVKHSGGNMYVYYCANAFSGADDYFYKAGEKKRHIITIDTINDEYYWYVNKSTFLYDGVTNIVGCTNNYELIIGTEKDLSAGWGLTGNFTNFVVLNYDLTSEEINQSYDAFTLLGAEETNLESFTTLDSPTTGALFSTPDIELNASYSITGSGNFTNTTCNVWYSNTSLFDFSSAVITGQTTNSSSMVFNNLPIGNFEWNCEACIVADADVTDYHCAMDNSNNTFVTGGTTNAQTYNTSTYETSLENYLLNVTTYNGTTPTNPFFYYNGTSSTATVSSIGGNDFQFSASKGIPLTVDYYNASFFFSYDINGVNQNSTATNQTVNNITLGLCDASLTTKFLNVTFKDEGTSVRINATIPSSTFDFYIGDPTITKTFTYSQNTNKSDYLFCFEPQDRIINTDYSISYAAQGYPQRTYSANEVWSNSTTNKTLYLLSDIDGQFVTFQVINLAEQPIAGVVVNATRDLLGIQTLVAEGTTDDAGSVTFWLNPNYAHSFSFLKSGYDQFITTLTPTQTSYTITLGGGTTGGTQEDYSKGISESILPGIGYLYNNTIYNFNYTLTSSYWTVTEFGFVLSNSSGPIGTTRAFTNGGIVNINNNTFNYPSIIMDYYYVINGNYTNNSLQWSVITDEDTSYSLKNFFTHLIFYMDSDSGTGLFRLTRFGLNIFIYVVIFLIVGIASYKFGMNNPLAMALLVFALVAFFDKGVGLISLQTQYSLLNNLPTFITALVVVSLFFREVNR